MRLSNAALLLAGAFISAAAAPAPPSSDPVIYTVLEHFAQDSSPGTRDCVEPTLDPKWNLARRKRSDWGDWRTAADKSLPRSTAQRLNHLLLAARELHPIGKARNKITRVPPPLILAKEDKPTTGPCALEANKEEVWHWYASRPAFNGTWAFVEIGAFADGKYPPPQLWALEYRNGQWQLRYQATRTLWYD